LDGGNNIRAYHLVRAIARVSEVTLFCFAYTEEEQKHMEGLQPFVREVFMVSRESCRYRRNEHLPRLLRLFKKILASCHPMQPVSVQDWESLEADELIQHLNRRRFDLVWGQWLGSVRFLAHFEGAKRVLNLNDIEHRKLGHRLRRSTFNRSTPFDCIEFLKLRHFERGLTRLPYEFAVCSEMDKQALGDGSRIWVVPNGVELPLAQPTPRPSTAELVLLFVGEMSYAPNIDAVQFFTRKIFPHIRREIPAVRFMIVGREPDHAVKALHDGQSIIVTGSVPSVEPYLEKATLVVVPIRFGGGTRIKILEAMAHGKAVVSTRVGAEGLDLESWKHLLVTDSPSSFTDACLLLLRDRPLRERIAAEGFHLVRAKYQWGMIERLVEEIATTH